MDFPAKQSEKAIASTATPARQDAKFSGREMSWPRVWAMELPAQRLPKATALTAKLPARRDAERGRAMAMVALRRRELAKARGWLRVSHARWPKRPEPYSAPVWT